MTWFCPAWVMSATLPAATLETEKMKARRAAGGLLHHLTPRFSSRIQAQQRENRPFRDLHRVGLCRQQSLVVNTWLTTPTPSCVSCVSQLQIQYPAQKVHRSQVYKNKTDQHFRIQFWCELIQEECWILQRSILKKIQGHQITVFSHLAK